MFRFFEKRMLFCSVVIDILAFIQSIIKLNYTDTPDYSRLRQLLYNAKCSFSNKQSTVLPSYKLTMESDETSIKASPSRRKYNIDNSSKVGRYICKYIFIEKKVFR